MMQRPINIEFKWLWREAVVAQLEVPFQNFTGRLKENTKNPPVMLAGLGVVF
jgi:hypothetical protein